MRLYHFMSAKYALEAIRNRRLKIAHINDLNDPFELLAQNLSDPNWRRVFLGVKRQASAILGFLCFSRIWRNPIMWAHYADRHRGIVLGFDIPDPVCQPIRYSKDRPDTVQTLLENGKNPTTEQLIDWLQTKFEGWQYEEEVRLVCRLKDALAEGGLYFSRFSEDLQLREAIVGLSASVEAVGEIKNVIAEEELEIEVIRAELAAKTFDVVPLPSTNCSGYTRIS